MVMVVSLFSVFDPHQSLPILTWVTPLFILGVVYPGISLGIPNRGILYSIPASSLYPEVDSLLGAYSYSSFNPFFYYLGLGVLFHNFLGIFPYIFTSSSHISFSIPLAFCLWVSPLIFEWGGSPGAMLVNLVPNGTPVILMPFIVAIESIRIIIRPVTLSVRLTANIVAGHLLFSLCGNGFEGPLSISLLLVCQTMLTALELAVAVIQAYVFTVLVTLYSKETFTIVEHCLIGTFNATC